MSDPAELEWAELVVLVRELKNDNDRLKGTYAPPALEVIDGVMSDKSQDADWLRARYFEQSARIALLEEVVKAAETDFYARTGMNATERLAAWNSLADALAKLEKSGV